MIINTLHTYTCVIVFICTTFNNRDTVYVSAEIILYNKIDI